MKKRAYTAPHVEVCTIGVVSMIADSVKSVSSSVFKSGISGGSGSARTRRRRDAWSNGWED